MEKVFFIYCRAGKKIVMCTASKELAMTNAKILNDEFGVKNLYEVHETIFVYGK